MLKITIARSDSGKAFTWFSESFDTTGLTLISPNMYYGDDCTYLVA